MIIWCAVRCHGILKSSSGLVRLRERGMKRRGGEKEGGDQKEGRERDETGKDDRGEILT